MKVSVVIPCHTRHVLYLPDVLKSLDEQTVKPDEIIVMASNESAGVNRQRGAVASKGDIIVYQDADDLAHRQRIELIRYAFLMNTDVVHVMHQYASSRQPYYVDRWMAKEYDIEICCKASIKVQCHPNNTYPYSNGSIATLREVLEKAEWYDYPRGQDLEYNLRVGRLYGNRMLRMPAELILYRRHLSLDEKNRTSAG